jgi:DNA-binding MarR family transcriptional regulator
MIPSDSREIAKLLQNLHQAMHRRLGPAPASDLQELTILQLRTMGFIYEHPKVSMGELTAEFAITKASVNALVNRLCRKGWLTRLRDPEDRRVVRLSLKRPAAKKIEALIRRKQTIAEQALEALSPTDRKTFARILRTISTHIQDRT